MNSVRGLRVAPLVRVSTETQAQKGESLRTQIAMIQKAVESIGAVIPPELWCYVGQESATEKDERILLDKLLDDSGKGLFDALMVSDVSRWSRNNLKSEQGLETLRRNGIRFFDLVTEIDLFNPDELIVLQLKVNIHSYSALQLAKKSLLNKIARAERGIPVINLPWGRTYDKAKGQWKVDPVKQARMEKACKDYLEGRNYELVAKELGVSRCYMYYLFQNKLGDELDIRFKSRKFPIEKTVRVGMPRLVSKELEAAVKARIAHNRRVRPGTRKNYYLLKGMIRCANCGRSLLGHTIKNKGDRKAYHYYKHPGEGCKSFNYAPGLPIEDAVIAELFAHFGDKPKLEKAIKRANSKMSERPKLEKQIQSREKELTKIQRQEQKLVKAIMNETLPEAIVKKEMAGLQERMELINKEMAQIREKMEGIPAPAKVSELALRVEQSYLKSDTRLQEMTLEDKRNLLEAIFVNRKAYMDQESGVFIMRRPDGRWYFEVRGTLFAGINGVLEKNEDLRLSKLSIGIENSQGRKL
jgi:site-specific DNA recombinase